MIRNYQMAARLIWLVCMLYSVKLQAQLPKVNVDFFLNCPSLKNPGISPDGKYVFYLANDQRIGETTLHIQAVNEPWKKEVINGMSPNFSEDGKIITYISPTDGLVGLKLGSELSKQILGVKSYSTFIRGKQTYLIFRKGKDSLSIVDQNFEYILKIPNVTNYTVSPDGNLLATISREENKKQLNIFSLTDRKTKTVLKSSDISNVVFDPHVLQVAFLAKDMPTSSQSIYTYSIVNSQLEKPVGIQALGVPTTYSISNGGVFRFRANGTGLFFSIENLSPSPIIKDKILLDVWNYQDDLLQTEQMQKLTLKPNKYLCYLDIENRQVKRLVLEDELIITRQVGNADDIVIVQSYKGNYNESHWNPKSRQNTALIVTNTGRRVIIKQDVKEHLSNFSVSPDGNYVVYYDPEFASYFSINVVTGKSQSVTNGLITSWTKYSSTGLVNTNQLLDPVGIRGWMKDGVLIGSMYDIWLVDPANIRTAVNLTNNIGSKHKTVFNLAFEERDIMPFNKPILLKVFDTRSKCNGFYSLVVNENWQPLLKENYVGNNAFEARHFDYGPMVSDDLVMAKNITAFVIRRQAIDNFPNYYFTKDFKLFNDISNLHPEKKYNWLTSELHTFSIGNGDSTSGVLYKPRNFDPQKKYPVIFYCYQNLTQNLNRFPNSGVGGIIDFAHFVSDDYLVFTPDIYYSGNAGVSALRTMEAAAKYLSEKPWVNAKKLGINGHSLGGYEVNYIITHSKLFAAAITGAGISDLISHYGAINDLYGNSQQVMNERAPYLLPGSPWKNIQEYVDASPVLSIGNVVCPILIFHNMGDQAVPFTQSIEFFTGLRRAGKKVWLLQYDGENHSNSKNINVIDLEIRFKQFFDHYLKDKPAPMWMTRGIPAKMKGIDNGLELDKEIKTPEVMDNKQN